MKSDFGKTTNYVLAKVVSRENAVVYKVKLQNDSHVSEVGF